MEVKIVKQRVKSKKTTQDFGPSYKAARMSAKLRPPHKIKMGSKWISMPLRYGYIGDISEVLFLDRTVTIRALGTFRVRIKSHRFSQITTVLLEFSEEHTEMATNRAHGFV